jgi:hypothetical protein
MHGIPKERLSSALASWIMPATEPEWKRGRWHSFRYGMYMEAIVNANIGIGRNSALLRRGSLMRIEAQPGDRVSCTRGMLWLTQDRDPMDRVVCAGETFVIDRPGVVLVNALAADAVVEYPDAAATIVRARAAGNPTALSLAAEIGRIRSRVEPRVLRAMPAGARREIVEREALRMRRQVAWLVFQHLKNALAALLAGGVAGARKLLPIVAHARGDQPERSGGHGVGRALTPRRSAVDGQC